VKKQIDSYLKEYCQRLSDEQVQFLAQRLTQKLFGDAAEVLDFLSNTRELDKWLSSAASCKDFYDMIDLFQSIVEKEDQNRRQNAA
jgi:hypothetical protein